jgi:hypothetical protein
MHEEWRRDVDAIDSLFERVAPDSPCIFWDWFRRSLPLYEIAVEDVAYGCAAALVGLIDVGKKVLAAASGSDEAELDLIVGSRLRSGWPPDRGHLLS